VHKHAILTGVATIGAGILAAMMAISPAVAGPVAVHGITTHVVTVTATVAADSVNSAEAACGTGELLVGGGYTVKGTVTDRQVFIDAPTNNNSWLVEVVNPSPASPSLSFSAYAICAMSVPGKKGVSAYTTNVVAAEVDAPANDTAEADATCPAGQLRTGGGYDVFNVDSHWSVYLNGPINGDTWTVEIDNEVPVTTTFDSYALCLATKNSDPITNMAVSTVFAAATAPANSTKTADVSCSPKALMTGGGHQIASIGQDWSIQASAPVSANDWKVKVADLDSTSRDFDSIAVCLAKAP
jgi:hypothetical protein